MQTGQPIVAVSNLYFEYPGKRALNGVSFEIHSGWVVALVGPNGAGKSTLLRCLSALDDPFSGTINVCGIDTQEDPRRVHRVLGYLADFYGLYDDLTVRQCLTHLAAIHGVAPEDISAAVSTVIEEVELTSHSEAKAGALSRGLRQRLAIGQAIIHRPRLLVLDEPAAGLDPEARFALSQLIEKLRGQGITLIVSSHILSELEDYSTHMLTMDNGRVLDLRPIRDGFSATSAADPSAVPSPAGLKIQRLRFKLAAPADVVPVRMTAFEGVKLANLEVGGREVTIDFEGSPDQQAELLATAVAAGLKVYEAGPVQRSMQDVYLEQIRSGRSGGGAK